MNQHISSNTEKALEVAGIVAAIVIAIVTHRYAPNRPNYGPFDGGWQ